MDEAPESDILRSYEVALRIECPECDELVTVEQFICVRDPDRLRFECPACEAEVTVTSARGEDEDGDEDGDEDEDDRSDESGDEASGDAPTE